MKTTLLVLSLLLCASLFGADDAKAMQFFQKAAQLHGVADSKNLSSFEMEIAYSGLSGGIMSPSRWLQRVDFVKKLDFGARFVYDVNERGVLFQRRIEGTAGQFMYGYGAPKKYDLGDYYVGNAVDGVSNFSILAVRGELTDLKYLGTLELGGQVLDQVSFAYHGGEGTVYFSKDGRYAGRLEVDLKDNLKFYHVVTAYQSFGGLTVPSRFVLYNEKKTAGAYGKLVNFRANPALTDKDFEMAATARDKKGLINPFGLGLVPDNAAEFTGLKVAPRNITNSAAAQGLAAGDEIVAIGGKDITKGDYFDLENQFWTATSLDLTVLRGTAKREVKLVR